MAGWARVNRPDSGSVSTLRATRCLSFARRLSVWLAVVPVPRARQMSLARSSLSVPGASGIDVAPHRGALAAGEQTVAVYASGLDRLYPLGNRNLLECAGGPGLRVNEMAPGVA